MGIPKGGIAFFDSGIGGLTVLASCRKLLPTYDFYYYGDNRHAPYGNQPKEKIKKYTLRCFQKFKRLNACVAVVACNTVTALCIEELRARFSFPIVGTEPALRTAAKKGGEIFVLSTRATYESDRFVQLFARIKAEYPQANMIAYPCDGLAGAIEKNIGTCKEGKKPCDYTSYLPRGEPKRVVLGCTHYAYITKEIVDFYRAEVIDGNDGVARRLQSLLENLSFKNADHLQPQNEKISDKRGKRRSAVGGKTAKKTENPLQKNVDKKPKVGKIFFLGRAKKQNFCVFKQMFG